MAWRAGLCAGRQYRARVLVVLLGLAAGVLASEVTLRLAGRSFRPHLRNRVYLAEPDPLLGWRNRRNFAGPYGGDEFLTRVTLNSEGRRDPPARPDRIQGWTAPGARNPVSHAARDTRGGLRVAVLGDSQAFGDGVEDDETFAALLDGPHVVVRNHAVPGYGTDQEMLLFERDVRASAPDVVIVAVYLGNDLRDNADSGTWQYPKPHFVRDASDGLRLTGSPALRPPLVTPMIELFRALMRHSALLNTLAARAAEPDVPARRDRVWWESSGQPLAEIWAATPDATSRASLELTALLLRALVKQIADAGARPLVVLIPELGAVEIARDPSWQRDLARRAIDWRRPQRQIIAALCGAKDHGPSARAATRLCDSPRDSRTDGATCEPSALTTPRQRDGATLARQPGPDIEASATAPPWRCKSARGLIVIDALPGLARGERPYYPGWKHLTAEGHRILAGLLADELGVDETAHDHSAR